MVAYLFPGQGSQISGMGRALAEVSTEARAVFDEADEALGFPISKVCFEGTEEELKRTELTQPALLTTSVAALRALEAARPGLAPSFVAGHSLGEWSALVASGALDFTDAVRLVRERGRLMQVAVPEGEGAMMAVIGLPPDQVRTVCQDAAREADAVFVAANFNAPEQTVVSGHARASAVATQRLTEAGAKKVVPLAVSAPFHSPLMAPAATGLASALEPIPVRPLQTPVVANVDAVPNTEPGRVKRLLIEQVTASVRWVEVVQRIAATGERLALELGSGKVLTGLVRRIDRGLKVIPVQDPTSLDQALSAL